MKVLFFNEKTTEYGGIDVVLDLEIKGLISKGIEVKLFEFSNQEFLQYSITHKIASYFKVALGTFKLTELQKVVDEYKPDIIHFHNIHHLFGYPIWSKLDVKGAKVIQHLHNYYPYCLNANFFTDNKICTDCLDKNGYLNSIKKNCYSKNKLISVLLSVIRPKPNTFNEMGHFVDKFIAVSPFVKNLYANAGIENEKIDLLPNSIGNMEEAVDFVDGDYILFIGNIQQNKGIEVVCNAAEELPYLKFKIAGLGRDLEYYKSKYANLSNLQFLGGVYGSNKRELLMNAKFLFLPSLWYEPFMITALEGLQFGKVIVTTGMGGSADVVSNDTSYNITDLSNNALADLLSNLYNDIDLRKAKSKLCVERARLFTDEKHNQTLIDIYKSLLTTDN